MTDYAKLTVKEARALHYAAHKLPPDGGVSARHWTMLRLGRWHVQLSNFRWRKRALPRHDLHHVITGYACSPTGEFQMAAWEFAAGRFPNCWSTLFCLPLVGMGALLTPTASFAAFLRGRHGRTLYRTALTEDLLGMPVAELRTRMLPATLPNATMRDRIAYGRLLLLSMGLLLSPALLLALMLSVA
jgi:hypothetical protein